VNAPAVVVVAKTPVAGRVKTRLCPPCTLEQAAAIARAALADTLETVANTPARARVLALDGEPGAWVPPGFVVVPQCGGGLDARLAHAFASVAGPALLIGMDTPQVTPSLLAHAGGMLLAPGVDAVLGRARDGGWWAIGLRRADQRVFAGVPMSTDHTGRDQRARLDALGLHTCELDPLCDVDTFDDALAVRRLVPESRFGAAVAAVAAGAEVAAR
jgi:rSAM/selenodomain-associated transferase 1